MDAHRYVEFPPAPDLAEYVQSIWYRRISPSEAKHPARVVPDGCMDLIWVEDGVMVAGPDTRAWTGPLASGAEIVGLRFWPGMAPALLGLPATELLDQRAALEDISRSWAGEIDGRIGTNADAVAIGLALQASLRARLCRPLVVDHAVQHVAAVIQQSSAERQTRVDELADAVGLSERQLHRRCRDAFGYGPKLLARIIRFQRFLSLADAANGRPIAHLAAECGYADQAHLTREVNELAGLPPARLLAERAVRQDAPSPPGRGLG
jgi:AraC-like DNA-binding protein